MSPQNRDEEEPEPIDPKEASRAIKRHINRKRATEKRTRSSVPASMENAGGGESPQGPSHGEDCLKAIPIRNRDLVLVMEHSPQSQQSDWIHIQTGDNPERAIQISMAEMEFLLLKRDMLD